MLNKGERIEQFTEEVAELLMMTPDLKIPYVRFTASYKDHFKRAFRMSDFGYTKLIQLIDATDSVTVLNRPSFPQADWVIQLDQQAGDNFFDMKSRPTPVVDVIDEDETCPTKGEDEKSDVMERYGIINMKQQNTDDSSFFEKEECSVPIIPNISEEHKNNATMSKCIIAKEQMLSLDNIKMQISNKSRKGMAYSRDFLLELQGAPPSKERPRILPDLNIVYTNCILRKAVALPILPADVRLWKNHENEISFALAKPSPVIFYGDGVVRAQAGRNVRLIIRFCYNLVCFLQSQRANRITLDRFTDEYSRQFGKKCKVSEYGYNKLKAHCQGCRKCPKS